MLAWWDSLSLLSQIFACIAIPATIVLAIQTMMMFIGLDGDSIGDTDGDLSLDHDIGDIHIDTDISDGIFGDELPMGDPDPSGLSDLHILSLRGIIAFLVVFGWVGFMVDGGGGDMWLCLLIATISGFATMLLIALLMSAVMKLRNNGNINNRNAIGTSGRVYLTVPASRSGEGKVNVLLQGSYVEREAVTDEDVPIPTGSEVVVIGISGQTTLVVKRK